MNRLQARGRKHKALRTTNFLYGGYFEENGSAAVYTILTHNSGRQGLRVNLHPRNNLVNHSPTGFNWGYAGSGPAQLALAILYHFFAQSLHCHTKLAGELAVRHHQSFKFAHIVKLPQGRPFMMSTSEINAWWEDKKRKDHIAFDPEAESLLPGEPVEATA